MRRLLCLMGVVLTVCAACGRGTAAFELSKQAVTTTDADKLMLEAKKAPLEAIEPSDYPSARSEAISALVSAAREEGADSASLKKALEVVTPPTSRSQSIPTRVILAKFKDREAWIIVQNWNKPGSDLTHAKVWVIAAKGQALLYAASKL